MTADLTEADDCFHPVPVDDPMWTETTWWGFMVPERGIGAMIYTLFRPNLGVATLVTQVWNDEHVAPWASPYARSLWHLKMPDGDLDDLRLSFLHIRRLEPLKAYRLTYEDGGSCAFDLHYEGAMAPHVVAASPELGHFDQLCQVTGELHVDGEIIDVDCDAVRDRSWYVRDDFRSMRSAYTYGAVNADEHFLAYTRPADNAGDLGAVFGGYLVRDGEKADLKEGVRRVHSRRRGHPDELELTATDTLGRKLEARGRITSSLASQSTPGMFAYMSIAEWTIGDRQGHGEDHDVWSPDTLAERHRLRVQGSK
ncbi:MAG: hypothetical protein JO248_06475 [Acidimicrobiia bacterium]|nr:hypothetical protein [Acidimicrobiia bacterium]